MTDDPRKKIDALLNRIKEGKIEPDKAWDSVHELKGEYIEVLGKKYPNKNMEQSWHKYVGDRFQDVIFSIIKGYINKLKSQDSEFRNFDVLEESEIKKNEIIFRKLAVKYGEYMLLPDTDMAIVKIPDLDPWNSEIIAIISCKTSLRERIAQACYWKLKLLDSDVTKGIRIFLATADNDGDFAIKSRRRESYNGKSRDRIISEYELDGVYILRESFKEEWESDRVKRYEKLFEDLLNIFKRN
jgi:type II restriction enzyme